MYLSVQHVQVLLLFTAQSYAYPVVFVVKLTMKKYICILKVIYA